MENGFIYRATNLVSGKSYIGKTTKTLSARIAKHYTDSTKHTYAFANALRKYNKEHWHWEVLCIVPSGMLDIAEVCLIYFYDTYYSGYNSTFGGEDNPMNYKIYIEKVSRSKLGKKRPDQSLRITKINRFRKISNRTRSKMSKAVSGKNNPMFNKSHSNETRLAISKKLGSAEFNVYKNGIFVGTWTNKAECARFLKIDNSSITKYLNGKSKNSLGYTFVYRGGGR